MKTWTENFMVDSIKWLGLVARAEFRTLTKTTCDFRSTLFICKPNSQAYRRQQKKGVVYFPGVCNALPWRNRNPFSRLSYLVAFLSRHSTSCALGFLPAQDVAAKNGTLHAVTTLTLWENPHSSELTVSFSSNCPPQQQLTSEERIEFISFIQQ